ncbi:phage replication protein O%2C N-terminal domain [Yersinia rohdei]|uniref:replication protein n=1 Tax=Yersinia rohdei TaxID=29485 RepID=UPI0005DC57A6|nr:replication protein [Yersinia rohdei]CNJ37361.1 phage replication protein O%2C N-terminal domain [Yersinia rohdei]
MSNAIDYNNNVSPIRPHLEVVECRVADLDDGYTRIANELLEAVMCADLTARQLKVALAVIRKTYGFGKKTDRITNTQIAGMTGIHHTHVCTAKNEMIAMKIIITSGNHIGINKVVSDWNFNISQVSETLAKSANNSLAKVANDHSPTQLNTKETLQKKKETTPKSPEGNLVEKDKPKTKQPASSKVTFDRDRFKETWNCKANKHGLPRIVSISTTTEKGVKRLYESHLKHCKETKRIPRDMDTFINGYIEFGYTPSSFAMGENPAGKKYGIDTALTQRIIDQVISQEA